MTTFDVVFTVLGLAAGAVLVFLFIGTWSSGSTRREDRKADADGSPGIMPTLIAAGGTEAAHVHGHHGHFDHGGGHAHGFDGGGGGHGGGGHG